MKSRPNQIEGYVFTSYGKLKYLRDVVVCVESLRRYDPKRPVAIYCSEEHKEQLSNLKLDHWFAIIKILPEEDRSIVGFKHNLHRYMPFDRNMYLDSDMIWCRNPDPLWHVLSPYPYTITGIESADVYFGASKSLNVLSDILLRRRQRTLRRFGLTHLYRVQTGIMYASDPSVTRSVGELASSYLDKMEETHFVSRTREKDRNMESCEWSLGMAMSKLDLFVYPWFNGYESPQLDFISYLTKWNEDFTSVKCKYYCNPFIYSLRGIRNPAIHRLLMGTFGMLPRSRDHFWVTPYVLHFGWNHEKKHWNRYVSDRWSRITEPVLI
jgi:hypothetical protein